MSGFSTVLIGNESLLVHCAEMLQSRGHQLRAIVTRNGEVESWARANNIAVVQPGPGLADRLAGQACDWLFSIANLDLIPDAVLNIASQGAINFHDGPLPRYAGLNAPVWALINRETRFGVTWHMIDGGIDEGDIVAQTEFDIAPTDTALTLNTRCFEAAIESFAQVLDRIESGNTSHTRQNLADRSYFARDDRPAAAGRLEFSADAQDILALIRALDHGTYWNPLTCAKFEASDQVYLITGAELAEGDSDAAPGTVLDISADRLVVATGTQSIALTRIQDCHGKPIGVVDFARVGDMLASPSENEAQALDALMQAVAPGDGYWRGRLSQMRPAKLALAGGGGASGDTDTRLVPRQAKLAGDTLLAGLAAFSARIADVTALDLAYSDKAVLALARPGYVEGWLPLRFDVGGSSFATAAADFAQSLVKARKYPGFAADLSARIPDTTGLRMPDIGLATDGATGLIPGTCLTLEIRGDAVALHGDSRLSPAYLDLLESRLALWVSELATDGAADTPVADLPILPDAERQQLLHGWNATATAIDGKACVHSLFEAQAARTPEAIAIAFEGTEISYRDLNARANRVAHVLDGMGVGPGVLVGLYARRSLDMMIAALGILKAGGAYVPLDPAFPPARIAHYLGDSAAPVIVTQSALAGTLPDHSAAVLAVDDDPRLQAASDDNPGKAVAGADLAYVIYTSGSTGTPKGVMVEHRNVANFFSGMDERIRHDGRGVWLAVTSLSFDISVLELFYTLARGFKLVLSGDEDRTMVSSGNVHHSDRRMDFSLFFWGNDDGPGPKKYELLLEGAKYADQNGFCAVWTPERHFHAFGGPYPNPAVTGAAVAAVTKNLSVRSGSCVAPLHHPARIAEDWAVIDNLTNGRAGLGIASGWQPNDFVLRPENAPPNNKTAMFDTIDKIRRLWTGEAVEFPTGTGAPHAVVTQPRPVSKKLPIWVTTAGNPDTWREAGEIGANVLTHLLGQSVAEVGAKIEIYHDALRAAGHSPADHTVTLMLHSFVAADRETARDIAREPMKDYLRSAAGLIKQFAWVFPAFKRPKGVDNAFELDLGMLDDGELEEILDFAFLRYFEDSGLFGTVEDCLGRVEQLKQIGVDEIACLIDYGIAPDVVLEGLRPLAQVLARANMAVTIPDDDFSIAAQIRRHDVTHLQCTPSMAQMLVLDDGARGALAHVKQLYVGGEALSGALVKDLSLATAAPVENMYGPTETTIWSSTEAAAPGDPIVNIGKPIANSQLYVLDAQRQPVPVGIAGELYIGGHGVTRGYWQQPDLTGARFVDDPFVTADSRAPGGARMYATGDLVRRRADGKIDFLGRTDHQVKLRGYRIELGEIEARLNAFTGAGQAVVVTREDVPGDVRLVGYLTGVDHIDEAKLREALAAHLPDYMIPAHFVQLDAFPLTPNKKIDRKALPAPSDRPTTTKADSFVAPDNAVEQKIAEIWSHVLGVARIGAGDNFFELGGHSLLAVQAHREIRAALGVTRLSITDIFRFPTLSAIAARVQSEVQPTDTPPEPAASSERAQARSDAMSRRKAMRANRQR